MNNLIKPENNFMSFYKTRKRKRDTQLLLLSLVFGLFGVVGLLGIMFKW